MYTKPKRDDTIQGNLAALEASFIRALNELTFNSKPIITQLSVMAGKHAYGAHVISKIILSRLTESPAKLKLPILYLLDSICKNIGGPYIKSFAQELVPRFVQTFETLDLKSRQDFERVVQTWKTGHIFPAPVVKELETRIKIFIENAQNHQRVNSVNELNYNQSQVAEQNEYYYQDARLPPSNIHGVPLIPPSSMSAIPQYSYPIPTMPSSTGIAPSNSLQELLSSAGIFNDPSFRNFVSNQPCQDSSFPYIPLSTDDVKVRYDGAVVCLYEKQPMQCKTCGLRFDDSDIGKTRMASHLDWHFRRNRRTKERLRKPISRGYYLTEDQWLSSESHGEYFNEKKGASMFKDMDDDLDTMDRDKDGKRQRLEESADDDEGSNNSRTSLPSVRIEEGEEGVKCAICGEKFETYWNEEEEAWMFRDSQRDEMDHLRVYHGHCLRSISRKTIPEDLSATKEIM